MADRKAVSQVLKTASAKMRKLESESQMLKAKLAELEKKIEDQEKTSQANKMAMDLTLDEEVVKTITEKTAQLKTQDLKVVKAALELGVPGSKVASLGDLDSTSSARADTIQDPKKAFISILEGKR